MFKNRLAEGTLLSILFRPVAAWAAWLGALLFVFQSIRILTKAANFDVYYAAAVRFVMDANIHVIELHQFTYPTVTALLFLPLLVFGYEFGKIIYFLFSFLCFIWAIRIVNYNLLKNYKYQDWIIIVSVLLCGRFFLAVFDNQQTDLFVFFLVVAGLHYYSQGLSRSGLFWGLATVVKANPLFIILLPVFFRKWKVAGLMIAVALSMFLLPDLLREVLPDRTPQADSFSLPKVIYDYKDRYEDTHYSLSPTKEQLFSYTKEFLGITAATSSKGWWNQKENDLNQSLTRISHWYFASLSDPLVLFLFWCLFFSTMLLFLFIYKKPDLFSLGLLFYSAFVLIGPVSSKPHFVAMYGLFVIAIKNLFDRFTPWKLMFLTVIGVLLLFSGRSLLPDLIDIIGTWGHIGISFLFLWLYVYFMLWNSTAPPDS